MRKIFYIIISGLFLTIRANAQKKTIDTAELIGCKKFEYVDEPSISSNGQFVTYLIKDRPVGHQALIIQNINSGKKYECKDAYAIAFINDSKLMLKVGDTLKTFDLYKFKVVKTEIYASVFSSSHSDPAFILHKDLRGYYHLINTRTGNEKELPNYSTIEFDQTGSWLFAQKLKYGVVDEILRINPLTGQKISIYHSSDEQDSLRLIKYFQNSGSDKICLIFQEGRNEKVITHYFYWQSSQERALEIINDNSMFFKEGNRLSNDAEFTSDGQYLVFKLIQPKKIPDNRKANVNIWSYKDILIQSFQEYALNKSEGEAYFTACINLKSRKPLLLTSDTESAEILSYGHLALVKTDQYLGGASVPRFLRESYTPKVYLVSIADGSRTFVGDYKTISDQALISISPDGRYLAFNNPEQNCFDSFEIHTGKLRHLTDSAMINCKSQTVNVTGYLPVAGIAAWANDGKSFIIYDNFDIWLVDPSGQQPPYCLTQQVGQKEGIKFRLVNGNIKYRLGDHILLTAFDVKNKHNGLMLLSVVKSNKFKPKSLLPYTFYHENSQLAGNAHELSRSIKPIKAKNENRWLVSRESASTSSNLFITKDFKVYMAVSSVHPESQVNWLTSELVEWQPPKGPKLQGILYKPENFDPQKKYPLIINFYEQLSHRLYEFPKPELASDNLSIPLMVSNGYLVFTPDIYYEPGNLSNTTVGEWALNAIESSAKHLATLPYVNPAKIGIQGHSFGGMESAYIATHSKLFAAVMEASGATEPISHYLSIMNAFGGTQEYAADPNGIEVGHYLYGASLWERPDLYLRNSAILNADKITAPLLIMHNREDNSLNWHQGVALYLSMQRLQKPCWMLEYDHENHVLLEEKNALDYTIRMTQFFDHYLKGAPAPIWMTKGIPAKFKGIEDGYALDPGVEP